MVPVPDAVAREYLLLALRLDHHIPGLVDGYFGPADLKAQVDMEQLRLPGRLADDAAGLRSRLPDLVPDMARRRWLEVQLVALETQAAAVAGHALPYLEHVARCFDWRPQSAADAEIEAAAAVLEAHLPGSGTLAARLAAWDESVTIPPDAVGPVAEWLVERFRAGSRRDFGLPNGERLSVSLTRDKPWSGYNWYDGGLRSRVELNTDLPIRGPDLLRVVAHETYPGHHLDHAWKEAALVVGEGHLELSVLLINTPECLIGEGLANVAARFAVPADDEVPLLVELFERAGLPIARDAPAAHALAVQAATLRPARARLGAVAGNAAILRHIEGRSRQDVVDYLVTVGRQSPDRAEHRLDFIEHPLWRTYVFVYSEGEALLGRWLDQPGAEDPRERFGRLLRGAFTPSGIAAELGAAA